MLHYRSSFPPGTGSRTNSSESDPQANVGTSAAAKAGAGGRGRTPALPRRVRRPGQRLRAVPAGRHLGAAPEETPQGQGHPGATARVRGSLCDAARLHTRETAHWRRARASTALRVRARGALGLSVGGSWADRGRTVGRWAFPMLVNLAAHQWRRAAVRVLVIVHKIWKRGSYI